MHGIRLVASCGPVVCVCRSCGTIRARKVLNVVHIRPSVSVMAGVTSAGQYFVRFLLCVALFSSGLNAERGGKLHVLKVVKVFNSIFGDANIHSRAVYWVDGCVHMDFEAGAKAGASRNVGELVS